MYTPKSKIRFVEQNFDFYMNHIEEPVKQNAITYLRKVYPAIQDDAELLEKGDIYPTREDALAKIKSKVVSIDRLLQSEDIKGFIEANDISVEYFKTTLTYFIRSRQSSLIRVSNDGFSILGLVYSPRCKENMREDCQCLLEWCLLENIRGASNTKCRRQHNKL